ncbi:MAG: extracellular solute-binding protein, partial [Lachnospiraceae bacterium]|nr:extracellular solute-binding protein [Lachnospiraceae bacterium]
MDFKKWKRKTAFGLCAVLTMVSVIGAIPSPKVTAQEEGSTVESTTPSTEASSGEEYVSESISRNYTKVSAQYTAPLYQGDAIYFAAAANIQEIGSGEVTAESMDYQSAEEVVKLELSDTLTLQVEVPQTGRYFLLFDYYSYDESVLPVGMSMTLDGDYPFYECRNLTFESSWISPVEKLYDRYGDEIVTTPNKVKEWNQKYLMDNSYRYSVPLDVELTQGTHELSFTVKEGNFLFGGITLEAPTDVQEYAGSEEAAGDALITIQAEDFTYRNDSSIHAISAYDTAITPYEVQESVLNTIDADSFAEAGQSITYEFTVGQAGYYQIGMNYEQSDKSGFPVFLDVAVNGEIPNTQFQSYPLAYGSSYRTTTFTDDEEKPLSVWLEAGENQITFTISNQEIRHVLEGLDEVTSGVNDLALEITKVAGTNADKYRDLRLTRYIPDVGDRLNGYADKLYELQESVRAFSSDKKKTVAVLSSMIVAAEQIRSLAEEPDEIPYRVGELSSSANSANHHLANTVDQLLSNALSIDRIYIFQEEAKLPKKPGFFKSIGMTLHRFFTSFTDQSYSINNTDPDHLQVWVARSNQYVQVMQRMIDESFTPATGIEVDISIMPDQRKLVLSNASGDSPDVATGINYTIPYELAIRGALADMLQFEDFQEVAAPYEDGFFLTSTINDGIYAMPETMNFWVLYYRSDIMDKLGLEIPNTMQDVVDMLPELQMRGLNYYQPVSGMLTMRNFHGT